jgi:signal transduction histidine kinase
VRVVREAGMDGDWAVVAVSDDLLSIFEPFWRGSNVGQVDGSGLGLSNVKDAVEAHGRKILLESRYGAGTTVSVHLPIS